MREGTHLVAPTSRGPTGDTYSHTTPKYSVSAAKDSEYTEFGSDNLSRDDCVLHEDDNPSRSCFHQFLCSFLPHTPAEKALFAIITVATILGSLGVYSLFTAMAEDVQNTCGSLLTNFMAARLFLYIVDVAQLMALILDPDRPHMNLWIGSFVIYQLLKSAICVGVGFACAAAGHVAVGCIQALSQHSATDSPLLLIMAYIFASLDSIALGILIVTTVCAVAIGQIMLK